MNCEETQTKDCQVSLGTACAPWEGSSIQLPPNGRRAPDLDSKELPEMAATPRRFWTLESPGVPTEVISHTQKEAPRRSNKEVFTVL